MGDYYPDVSKPVPEATGLNYNFGDSAATTLQRWSKILLQMQQDLKDLQKENRELQEKLQS